MDCYSKGLSLHTHTHSDTHTYTCTHTHTHTHSIFSSAIVSYQGNSTPHVNNISRNLGQDIQLSVTLRNDGPSTIRNAAINIFIPAQLPSVTGDNYFYYPATLVSIS